MTPLLTKSDFKVARSCSVKLWYRKQGYPSSNDRNRFLSLLADAGMMVQALAQLDYPEGIFPPSRDLALDWTRNELEKENTVLFEAPLETARRHIRVDILVKHGNRVQLIEIKSRGIDVEHVNGTPHRRRQALSKIRELLEDLAFQKLVVQDLYPNFSISSYLILPDKNCINPIEDLAGKFEMIKQIDKNGFTSIDAVFKGNPEEVRKVGLLTKIDVTEEVDALLEEMQTESLKLEKQLQSGKKPKAKLGCFCRDCEFSVASDTFGESGFETCWGPAAHTQPHILELGQLGNVNEDEKVDKLIRRGKSSIYDIPVDWLKGKWNNRPWLQRTQNQPFLFEGFHKEVSKLQWPIHFIDFETAQPALPHYAGMKPYQKLLFQWSAHRLDAPDAQPIHSSWLHDSRHMPNPEFLQSLMDCLGNSGSILTWSAYEQGVLNALSHEPATTAHQKAWIRSALSRLVDMNQWAIKYYFHPDTGGKTSIKVTLPAVLKSSKSPLTSMWLKELDVFTTDNNGAIINPYEMLPALDLPGLTDGVHDGSGAMLAYHFLQHGEAAKNPELKAQYRDALLRYCQLDTLAMLIIWEEWGAMNERPDPSHISH